MFFFLWSDCCVLFIGWMINSGLSSEGLEDLGPQKVEQKYDADVSTGMTNDLPGLVMTFT